MHECTQAPLVVEPLLVVGDLFGAERAARGLSRDLSAPLDVGAVEYRGVGVTVAAGVGAREVPLGEAAGEDEADFPEGRGDLDFLSFGVVNY